MLTLLLSLLLFSIGLIQFLRFLNLIEKVLLLSSMMTNGKEEKKRKFEMMKVFMLFGNIWDFSPNIVYFHVFIEFFTKSFDCFLFHWLQTGFIFLIDVFLTFCLGIFNAVFLGSFVMKWKFIFGGKFNMIESPWNKLIYYFVIFNKRGVAMKWKF